MKDNEFVRCKLKQQEMEIHNLLDAKSRAELREWLMQNHKKGFSMGNGMIMGDYKNTKSINLSLFSLPL